MVNIQMRTSEFQSSSAKREAGGWRLGCWGCWVERSYNVKSGSLESWQKGDCQVWGSSSTPSTLGFFCVGTLGALATLHPAGIYCQDISGSSQCVLVSPSDCNLQFIKGFCLPLPTCLLWWTSILLFTPTRSFCCFFTVAYSKFLHFLYRSPLLYMQHVNIFFWSVVLLCLPS